MERSSTDFLDVLAFVRVVETGSFARAAERIGLSKPVLSRRVARLEDQLGARLLTRTARGTRPTQVGESYYARAANILAELEAARDLVAEATTRIAGPIRLTAPVSFGARYLGPALAEFAKQHPEVELDVSLDDRVVDLVGGGFDLAVRIGKLRDSALIARKLAPIRFLAVASPAWLEAEGRPETPADLAGHQLLTYANAGNAEWRFRDDDEWEHVRGRSRFRADSGELLRCAAIAGLGVAVMPSFLASNAIENGQLEVLLRDFPLEEVGLWAVMPPGRAATARVRELVDFLSQRFGPEPHWDPCWLAEREALPKPAPAWAKEYEEFVD